LTGDHARRSKALYSSNFKDEVSPMADDFLEHLRLWIRSACAEWGFKEPSEDYYVGVNGRLPVGLRTLLARGLAEGLIVTEGYQFRLKGLASHKGPYQWFSNRPWLAGPHPNWEYYVQAAEYVRLHRVAAALGLTLAFEDVAMDLALYRGNTLIVCVEVKVEAEKLHDLIKDVRKYEPSIDLQAPDRGNDPLRKAKYIVRGRPQCFSGVAIGARLEYRVDYPEGEAFRLAEDVIPWA